MANTPRSANPNSIDTHNINHLLRPSSTQVQMDDGSTGVVSLKDYNHAARIFRDGNFRLSPKYGFLYYVEFDLNPMITNVSNPTAQELGMIVKSVNLPKYSMEYKVHNAYNRVNIVQNKIKYEPVTITFHDDQADNVRSFWYDYYSFYYRDSDFNSATYQVISKYQERPSFEWGYTPRPVASYNAANAYQNYQYIQAIRIYSLYQKRFSQCELVNPVITSFRHGEHSASEGTSLLEHQMTVQFETVKYYTGYVTHNTAGGFVDLHYDNSPTPISTPNGVDVVGDGFGGITKPTDTITDLANYNLTTNGGSVVPTPNSGLANSLLGSLGLGNSATMGAAALTPSPNGYAIPSFGSLKGTGITTKVLGQAIKSSLINSAQNAISSAATGVVKGLFTSLTKSGSSVTNATGGSNAPGDSQTNQNSGNKLTGFVSNLQESVAAKATASLKALQNNLGEQAKNLQSQASSLTGSLGGGGGLGLNLDKAMSSVTGAAGGLGLNASSATSALGSIGSSLSGAVNSATSSLTSAVNSATSGAQSALNNVTQAASTALPISVAGGDLNATSYLQSQLNNGVDWGNNA